MENKTVEIIRLEVDEDTNEIWMKIADNEYYRYLHTNGNIKNIFRNIIINCLEASKVPYTEDEINYFLRELMVSHIKKIGITEIYRCRIFDIIDKYLKNKFHTGATKKRFGKINEKTLKKFLNTEFCYIAIGEILKEDTFFFLCSYVMIMNKSIVLTLPNGDKHELRLEKIKEIEGLCENEI